MITTGDVRRWATELPEAEETSHFRFRVPVFKVRGRTFCGMGEDETTAVFCVGEEQANTAALADPATYEAVRRPDARKSFLGLRVRLGGVSEEQARRLIEEAWRHQAPKRLVAAHGRHRPTSP
ncbi:MmcQ/YjbR family DNA-binding protein [Actinoallomurus sp. NPDC052274]|uniref:MmcQ/YjbR family DNA-binding protein n=1 Tax=Actinoallomurus sp. NPDC052274 TaxID=3155420 RepID=UPI00344555CB